MSSKSKKKKPALVVDDTPEENQQSQQQTPEQYIVLVLKGEVELEGIEAKVAEKLRAQKEQEFQLKTEVQRLTENLKRAQDHLLQLHGRIDENTRLLLEQEGERRGVSLAKG